MDHGITSKRQGEGGRAMGEIDNMYVHVGKREREER